ncbi:MAG: phosphoribosylamine--glycine ligase [Archangium sp.]|nr:phosphoribosylamine--glycine ligase [Archangium sp.]
MKLLLLGSGGREHALAWKLVQSPLVTSLVVAPGNPGIAALPRAECVVLDPTKSGPVVELARSRAIDLVVVGPEAPLVAGVGDALRSAGFDVFGPDAAGARIEGSKAFAKEIMQAAGVPTAKFEVFTEAEAAARRALEWGPVVVKADGLAAGKGVVVATSGAEAAEACRELAKIPGGKQILLEDVLTGPELSVMALCDGERWVLLAPSQDHKRVFEGDTGPNTGGMGAYAPANFLSAAQLEEIGRTVIGPTLRELARRGANFKGALYAGLMLTPSGPKVLEFNARLGDPETQVLMMQLDEDLVPLLRDCARGTLQARALKQRAGFSVGIVLAAAGYPESPRTGAEISASVPRDDQQLFHAGTKSVDGKLVTSGGRVMTACAFGSTIGAARESALALAKSVTWEGRHFRADIGAKAP